MAQKGTSHDVANAVARLIEALKAAYGADYAFVIMGAGQKIAASNLKDGVVEPRVVPDYDRADNDVPVGDP